MENVRVIISNNTPGGYDANTLRFLNSNHNITYTENTENIGYGRNISKLINSVDDGHLVIVGDDDEMDVEDFIALVDYLKKNPSQSSYIVDTLISDSRGEKKLWEHRFKSGPLSLGVIVSEVLLRGLAGSGFLSGYCFEASHLKRLLALNTCEKCRWLHQLIFLESVIAGNKYSYLSISPVHVNLQKTGRPRYSSSRWILLWLDRLKYIYKIGPVLGPRRTVLILIIIREILSIAIWKEILRFLLLHPKTWRARVMSIWKSLLI